MNLVLGVSILLCMGPYLAVQMTMVTVWDFADKATFNFVGFIQAISAKISPFLSRFTNHPADGFMVVFMFWLGVLIPSYFFYEMYLVRENGFSFPRAVVYNLFRIGPIYMNFMNVYVMCHKEAHLTPGGIFKSNSILHFLFNRIFNHWAGLFQGLIPGGFTYSHILNHHKYDNDFRDVYTTAYRPRDSIISFIKYIPEWFCYASNLSSFVSFVREGRWSLALKTFIASSLHAFFFYLCYLGSGSSLPFLVMYCIYPFLEGSVLLSIVNFVWHGFIDPRDPSNEYVNSTTIVDGLNFTLQEEYHVVHHQYPGLHWTRHAEMFEKHRPNYYQKNMPGTIFHKENIFVIFGLMMSKSYDKLASLFYDPNNQLDMPRSELAQLMKLRLQACGHDLALAVGKTHKRQYVSSVSPSSPSSSSPSSTTLSSSTTSTSSPSSSILSHPDR